MQTSNSNFSLRGEKVEVVNDYEYLCMLFNYNGRFWKGELELMRKATRALDSLIGTSRKLDLPVDIQIESFNPMVVTVLTYGREILGDNIIREIELLHLKFMKNVLRVHRYTSTDIVYRELGVYPLEIAIKCKMIHFWSRLVMGRYTKLSYVMYSY